MISFFIFLDGMIVLNDTLLDFGSLNLFNRILAPTTFNNIYTGKINEKYHLTAILFWFSSIKGISRFIEKMKVLKSRKIT
jgi:hypothetical protein